VASERVAAAGDVMLRLQLGLMQPGWVVYCGYYAVWHAAAVCCSGLQQQQAGRVCCGAFCAAAGGVCRYVHMLLLALYIH
jgi:hypothetical protein